MIYFMMSLNSQFKKEADYSSASCFFVERNETLSAINGVYSSGEKILLPGEESESNSESDDSDE